MRLISAILLLSTAAMPLAAGAGLTMPHIFSDNMVIQADTAAALWGKATPGATVAVDASWGARSTTTAGDDGRWQAAIATPAPSFDPQRITVSSGTDTLRFDNVLAGEVWLASGQSNMEMPLRGFWNQPVEDGGEDITFSRTLGRGIRFLTVPKAASYTPMEDIDATWAVSDPSTAGEFSAVAWHFARSLRDMLDRPVGIISCAYGGSKVEGWEPADLIARYPDRDLEAERRDTAMNDWERVGVMYNAMLRPVVPYTLRGFIWNQGESNVGGHAYYGDRQRDMLGHWREIWADSTLPFYFVELPGWEYGNVDGIDAALFREAQQEAADATEGAWAVSTTDLVYPDEADDIHARCKRPIGVRLARLAATHTYGLQGIPSTFPRFRSMDVDGNRATLCFDNAYNGFTPNDALEGFEAAGSDRVFHPASATIDRDRLTIEVNCPEVDHIESVRYCFRNFAIGKVRDLNGHPLVPFRTDRW